MVIAFDFDGVLDNILLHGFIKKIRKSENEIWVVTMRKDNEYNNKIMAPVLNKLGISKFNVIFCNDKPKWEWLKDINADIYIDNIFDEFDVIKNYTNTVPLLWM